MKRRADQTFCFHLITCFSGWLSRRHMRRQSDSISVNRIIVHIWMDGNIRKTDICITIHKLLNTHKHATIIACTHPVIHTLYSLSYLVTHTLTHLITHSFTPSHIPFSHKGCFVATKQPLSLRKIQIVNKQDCNIHTMTMLPWAVSNRHYNPCPE